MDSINEHHFGQDDRHVGLKAQTENLEHIRSVSSINMSPELFEKLYLSPQNAVRGDLRRTFANPTPVALVGFCLGLTPLSCDLMGWRGAGGAGAASTSVFTTFEYLLAVEQNH
ncbi:hypothetical protein PV11_05640 [Exophiala sideris]|uniref:Uncharacterized protein n=1 Tax=Exophiala sideris TaxID=1016849 RepID=A0A0D1YQK5_9EURO|nr:hypothetical protein PV11_05640 [Exophiala sideris]